MFESLFYLKVYHLLSLNSLFTLLHYLSQVSYNSSHILNSKNFLKGFVYCINTIHLRLWQSTFSPLY